MAGDTKQSEIIRQYFIKLREFITENKYLIYNSMEDKRHLDKYKGMNTIYFFAIDDKKDMFKVGRTIDIVQRLRNYNVGRIREVSLKYLAIVQNPKLIEQCTRLKLKSHQIIDNREIYGIKAESLKEIINECYAKHMSSNEHDELYEELGKLLGMYAYIKDKDNITPYIVINK